MINYETILSSYGDKLTLLEWLKKVEEALADASLSSVEVVQSASNKAYFKFIFADSTHVDSPLLTLPKGDTGATGPQGPQGPAGADGQDGADGVSVVNVSVNASNHLIVTLSSGLSVDAGEISVPSITVDSAISNTSENPVQNKVIYSALANKQDKLEPEQVPGTLASVLGFDSSMQVTDGKITASLVDSGNATNKYVLTADGSGNASWQEVEGGTQPTGQVTTTFTLPQDVQSMLTVPHGMVIFSPNSGVDTLANSHPNIIFGVGYFSAQTDIYNISDNTTSLTSNLYGMTSTQTPFVSDYQYFGSKDINGTIYYGCNRSRYSIAILTYKNLNTSNVLPSLTISGKIIKIVNGNLITETFNGTVTSRTVTSTSSSKYASVDLIIGKSTNDLICLIEIDSITVN